MLGTSYKDKDRIQLRRNIDEFQDQVNMVIDDMVNDSQFSKIKSKLLKLQTLKFDKIQHKKYINVYAFIMGYVFLDEKMFKTFAPQPIYTLYDKTYMIEMPDIIRYRRLWQNIMAGRQKYDIDEEDKKVTTLKNFFPGISESDIQFEINKKKKKKGL